MALDFQRPDPSSPAAVASAQFTVVRRGYREEEVRDFLRQVSVEMARLLERERFLENELKALKARGPVDVSSIDEATITEMLGAEAARVLSAAREAAQAMRDRAAESAEQIVKDASREASRLLEESTIEASRRRTDVSTEAEQELELAKQQGREMVAEVRAYRERVLADVAKRTEEARRELERLVHERERLLVAFERAKHVAGDVVGDLSDFDEAIRGTGIVPPLVPPDAPPPPRPTRTTDTPIFDAMQYEDELGTGHRSSDPAENTTSEPESTVSATTLSDTEQEVQAEEVIDAPAGLPPTPAIDTTVESTVTESDTVSDESIAPVVSIFDRRRKREEAVETTPNRDTLRNSGETSQHPVFERVEAEPAAPTIPTQTESTQTSRVDDIFERLRRAGSHRVARETSEDLAKLDPAEANPTTAKSVVPRPVDPSVFRQRDEVVAGVVESMARVVKRHLADTENSLLTHIGTKKSSLIIDAMVPSVEDQSRALANSMKEDVTSIAVDAARSLSDARRADLRLIVVNDPLFESVVELIATEVFRPLRTKIVAALESAVGDRDALMKSVRAIFADRKTRHVVSAITDIACLAYARGLFLGCDTTTQMCWAVDPNGPACADAEDNALAGCVKHGEKFPTGHVHPLAHAGCRCLVVPLEK